MKFSSQTLRPLLLAVAISCTLIPIGAMAGFKEGEAAYVKGDYANALKELKPLATKGNAKAQYFLGLMYAKGEGVAQDYMGAAWHYGLAAAQGHAGALNNLGVMYDKGQGVAPDHTEAARLYGLAAAKGNADAQFNLGELYKYGQGVAQDYKEAVRLYGLAAAQGHAVAANRLTIVRQKEQAANTTPIKQKEEVCTVSDTVHAWVCEARRMAKRSEEINKAFGNGFELNK